MMTMLYNEDCFTYDDHEINKVSFHLGIQQQYKDNDT